MATMSAPNHRLTNDDTTTAAAIELIDVGHHYGDLVALQDVSMTLRPKQVTCIVGPSGCGKSTVLDLISGLQPCLTGTIKQNGKPVLGPNKSSAMVFQKPALYPWLTVLKNITLGLKVRGVSKSEATQRAMDMLDAVGLSGFHKSYPHELSGGMAQRVGIARALVLRPAVLLMDEPFAAVDAYTRLKLQDELRSIITDLESTVVFVTHDISESVLLGDMVAVMSSRPGTVLKTFDIPAAAKSRATPEHSQYSEEILQLLSHES